VAGAAPPAPVSPAAGVVLLTLCDSETPLWLAPGHDTAEIRDWVSFHTGAPLAAPGEAAFALGGWPALQPLDAYRVGRPDYPDRSATLIVECDRLEPAGARLTGPGIRRAALLSLPEVAAFRRNAALFPLGLDFFFTAGDRLAALPRTTRVEGG
jgi:alpha-D-ribose 1-methylphosphonate 5-triphosphate synthase subunit PhnH